VKALAPAKLNWKPLPQRGQEWHPSSARLATTRRPGQQQHIDPAGHHHREPGVGAGRLDGRRREAEHRGRDQQAEDRHRNREVGQDQDSRQILEDDEGAERDLQPHHRQRGG